MKNVTCLHRLIIVTLIIVFVPTLARAESWATVQWVADGDTIVLGDGRHVRYIAIDTPEIDHAHNRAEPMAYAARELNRQLVQGQRIRLVGEEEEKDRYGRTLAQVYREDGTWVNAELVRQGRAHVSCRSPNTAQCAALLAVQREAMHSRRGLWRLLDPGEQPRRAYLGNRRSLRFHAADCAQGQRMAAANRVVLTNQWDAFWQGYAPAAECVLFPPED